MNHDVIVPVGISNRHIHLSQEDAETLGIQAKPIRWLGVADFYASDVTVTCSGLSLRVLLPHRNYTQVELLPSDCQWVGIYPHFSASGNLDNAPLVTITHGNREIRARAIISFPHIHASYEWLTGRDNCDVVLLAPRMKMMNVSIFRGPNWPAVLHIDQEEALGAGWTRGISPIYQARVVDPWGYP